MRKVNYLLIVILITMVTACNTNGKKSEINKNVADKIFTNGKVYTVNKNLDRAEAVAIKDNKEQILQHHLI